MNKIIFAVALLWASSAHALVGTTVDGFAACFSKSDVEDLVKYSVAKDQASFNALLAAKRCIILKGGVTVTITESPGVFGTLTQFAIEAVKMWTVREGITDYR